MNQLRHLFSMAEITEGKATIHFPDATQAPLIAVDDAY
jgi:hypothetical protein